MNPNHERPLMTSEEAPAPQSPAPRTISDHYLRSTQSEIDHYRRKVDSDLKWLENGIKDLRQGIERASIPDQRNLASTVADVIESAARLRAAYQAREMLQHISTDTAPED
jgi:hypothetical protein